MQKATSLNGGGSRVSVLGINIEVFAIPGDLENSIPSKSGVSRTRDAIFVFPPCSVVGRWALGLEAPEGSFSFFFHFGAEV